MNVVDSSGWIEYLSGGPDAPFFRGPIEDTQAPLVPALSLFAVHRHLLRHAGRDEALQMVAALRQGRIIDLDDRVSLDAAELSVATRLALTDSIMLATARAHGAMLWTQDADFEGLEDVQFKRKS